LKTAVRTNRESKKTSKKVASAAFIPLAFGSFVMSDDTPPTLFDFGKADAAKDWQTFNDGVTGGVSVGKCKITDDKTLEFFGTLSWRTTAGSPRCGRRPRS
jgi:hypothetical protein